MFRYKFIIILNRHIFKSKLTTNPFQKVNSQIINILMLNWANIQNKNKSVNGDTLQIQHTIMTFQEKLIELKQQMFNLITTKDISFYEI